MRVDVGMENSIFVHVTYVPYIAAAGELKSKPTQHSVKELREIGIQPDFLICRSEKFLDNEIKSKIGLFCSVRPENVIAAYDARTIYEVPLNLNFEKFDDRVVKRLGLKEDGPLDLSLWKDVVSRLLNPKREVTIGLVGKYVDLKESYKSLHEALVHAGLPWEAQVNVEYIDSEEIEREGLDRLRGLDGVLVPGGFGDRGVEGKMKAIGWARENSVPFFGICYGMQLAAIEFARNVCGIKDATSREFAEEAVQSKNFVVDYMEEQRGVEDFGGTMRLGSYPCR